MKSKMESKDGKISEQVDLVVRWLEMGRSVSW